MFVLEKKNKDTMDALQIIAKALSFKKLKVFGVAGTKDKRGITTQRVTAFKLFPDNLKAKCSNLKNIKIGNVKFSDKELHFGMLSGNKFTITLRDVNSCEEEIGIAMGNIKEKGFVNYFGLQR